MRDFVRRVPDRMLSAGAVLGTVVALATLVGLVIGIRPVFLRSGSMAPTLPTGSLAFAHQVPAADLAVGDIVCVRTESGSRVTHRVTAVEVTDGRTVLTLRGDANDTADPQPYPVTSAYRVFGHVPFLGFLVGAAFTPIGLFLLGFFVMGLLMLLARGDRKPPGPGAGPPPPARTPGRRSARRPVIVAAGVALSVLGPGQVGGAWAAPWTDPVTISGTTLTAGTVPAPATFTCGGLGVLSVTFNWAAVTGATDYTLHYGSGGSLTVAVSGTTKTITAAISGGTAWVQANRNFGSTTWTSVASNTRSYTVAVVSLCS